jgi:hypothetical protein
MPSEGVRTNYSLVALVSNPTPQHVSIKWDKNHGVLTDIQSGWQAASRHLPVHSSQSALQPVSLQLSQFICTSASYRPALLSSGKQVHLQCSTAYSARTAQSVQQWTTGRSTEIRFPVDAKLFSSPQRPDRL